MDLDQLRTAIALLQHRTVNKTAAAQGLAPSSISDRVRRLEAELGAPLFLRDRAGMHPTAAGRSYLVTAAAALEALDDAAEQFRAGPGLSVGAQASIAGELLPAVLDELRQARPELQVQLRPDPDRDRLLTALGHGEIDVAVLLDAGAHIGDLGFSGSASDLEYLDVREVAMTVVAPPDHPLLGRPVTMAEIQRTGGLVGREPRCSFWMATRRWLGSDVGLTAVGGLAQVREWVASGRGVALLPEFAVRADLDSGRLEAVDVQAPPLRLRLIWREDHPGVSELRPLLYALTQA
ncbi:LysR family transcriptional regulator [Amycolatopsis balhimycina DSM 5908]|uniref:LysR family transcriptional regulator n=1 Tax=Amycolatopsis balhimycina DSM 5908 TaxID=1081091 RepID=A0A428X5V8_AMYBA|nr:LysR family transcriptional regulator [Amycolatopsis balhimycina]RSM50637.1 LysR family transcriptional regulator [Amycolatopsis balhimycina DSM 5908]